jgi:hypothetical protein
MKAMQSASSVGRLTREGGSRQMWRELVDVVV